jgi:carnosine synthase
MAREKSIDFELCVEELDAPPPLTVDTDQGQRSGQKRGRARSQFEVEQLIASPGNLPRPMTAQQREDALRTLEPTATYQMLARVPPELLERGDEDGQKLRRSVARGATMVFICAGLQGKRFTFERAAALGIKCVVIEHPGSWAESLVDEGLVAKFLPVDMGQSSDEIFNQAQKHIKSLGSDGKTGTADGICTFVELSVPLVARLCESLGLPGHLPTSVDAARNKHATRAALKTAGLPTPKNHLIVTEADVTFAGEKVGFPAVLKPVSGAASLGVKKVTSVADLKSTWQEIVDELKTLVVSSGALVKGTPGGAGVQADTNVDLTVLMEQYLDGPEVDVDVVMSNGQHVYAGVSDNGPTLEPYFNETWAVAPSKLPKNQQRELRDLSVNIVKAMGFTSGVFHVECKYTSSGPQLIEVNARMGGGQVHECNWRTWGVELVEETLFAALGIPARPPVPKEPLTSVAYCYVNAERSGTAGDLQALGELVKRDKVVWAKPLVKPGDAVVGPADGLPTWLADLFVEGRSPTEALEFLLALQKEQPVKVL